MQRGRAGGDGQGGGPGRTVRFQIVVAYGGYPFQAKKRADMFGPGLGGLNKRCFSVKRGGAFALRQVATMMQATDAPWTRPAGCMVWGLGLRV